MTEQEIIDVLIENRGIGKGDWFLPKEVKNYLFKHAEELEGKGYILKEFNPECNWVDVNVMNRNWESNNGIYCLESEPDRLYTSVSLSKKDVDFILSTLDYWRGYSADQTDEALDRLRTIYNKLEETNFTKLAEEKE